MHNQNNNGRKEISEKSGPDILKELFLALRDEDHPIDEVKNDMNPNKFKFISNQNNTNMQLSNQKIHYEDLQQMKNTLLNLI